MKSWLEQHGGSGTVRFYGCPGEEGGSGKTFMVREGLFDDVDAAVTWHPEAFAGMFNVSTLANIQAAPGGLRGSPPMPLTPHIWDAARWMP